MALGTERIDVRFEGEDGTVFRYLVVLTFLICKFMQPNLSAKTEMHNSGFSILHVLPFSSILLVLTKYLCNCLQTNYLRW